MCVYISDNEVSDCAPEINYIMFSVLLQIKDPKASEIMDVYEAKLASLQVCSEYCDIYSSLAKGQPVA